MGKDQGEVSFFWIQSLKKQHSSEEERMPLLRHHLSPSLHVGLSAHWTCTGITVLRDAIVSAQVAAVRNGEKQTSTLTSTSSPSPPLPHLCLSLCSHCSRPMTQTLQTAKHTAHGEVLFNWIGDGQHSTNTSLGTHKNSGSFIQQKW